MANYALRIGTVKATITHTTIPAVSGTAMSVLVSKQTSVVYETSSATFSYSSQVPGLPFLAAASLSTAPMWLVRYSASYGGASTGFGTRIPQIDVMSGRGGINPPNSDRTHGGGEGLGLGTGTPETSRCCYIGSWFLFTPDGTDLEFRMRTSAGAAPPTYYSGMQLIAIPVTDFPDPVRLQRQVDLFGDQMTPTFGAGAPTVVTTDPFTPIWNVNEILANTGTYLILASCQGETAVNNSIQYRMLVDGVPQKATVLRGAKDARDDFPFIYESVHNLNAGSHSFTIEGGSAAGVANKTFRSARIFLLRLDNFEVFGSIRSDTSVQPNTEYPIWDSAPLNRTIVPSNATGEYILSVGSSIADRSDPGGIMSRIYNLTANTPTYEHCSFVQRDNAPSGGDPFVLSSVGCELCNSATTYSLQHCGNDTSGTPDDINVSHRELVLVGLTKKAAPPPPGLSLLIQDGCSVSEGQSSAVGSLPGVLGAASTSTIAESAALIGDSPPVGIPLAHPRLFFYNNNRLARLQASRLANDAQWQNFINTKPYWHWWPFALQYIVNPTPTTLNEALAACDDIFAESLDGVFDDDGVFTGEYVKEAAMFYDWMYGVLDETRKRKLEDFMAGAMYMQLTADTISRSVYTGSMKWGWAVGSPLNNYHATQIKGLAYAAIAMYHHQPTTWGYPWGTTNPSQRYAINIPFKVNTAPYFTDLYECLLYKMDNMDMPVWGNTTARDGHTCSGGGWNEGAHYGSRPWRDIPEIAMILKYSGGKDYLVGNPVFKDRISYILFDSMPHTMPKPGGVAIPAMELGDNTGGPGDSGMDMDMSHRISMMMSVESFNGTEEATWGQFWLQNSVPPSSGGVITSPGHDFLLYDPTRPATDYRTVAPRHWYSRANGLVASRNHWGADGTHVFFTSQDQSEDHADHDQNCIQIFKGGSGIAFEWDGYLLGDKRAGGGGKFWHTDDHSGLTIARNQPMDPAGYSPCTPRTVRGQQRYADYNTYPNINTVTGKISRQIGNSLYSYGQGDCADAYRAIPVCASPASTSTYYNEAKLNNVYFRDFVHIRSINCLAVYDRVRCIGFYVNGPATVNWMYPRQQPALQGNRVVVTQGVNRLFKDYVHPTSGIPASAFVNVAGKMNWWREETDIPLTNGVGHLCTAIEVTSSSQSAMRPIFAAGNGATDGFRGVTFTDVAARHHVLFSNELLATVPANMYYQVVKGNNADRHIICNLQIGQTYFVTETDLGGGIFRYSLAVSLVGLSSDSAGTLTFTPGDLGTQTTAVISYADRTDIQENTVLVADKAILPADSCNTVEATQLVTASQVFITAADTCNTVSATSVTGPLNVFDSVSTSEAVALEIDTAPSLIWSEKAIEVGTTPLRPREDRSRSFFDPDPNNGSLYDVLADSNDTTFVVAAGASAEFASIDVGLTNPGTYVGRLRLVQPVVRIVYADIQSSNNARVGVSLSGLGLQMLASTYREKPLFDASVPVDIEFDPLVVDIVNSQFNDMGMNLSISGNPIGENFQVRISEIYLRVLSLTTSEKVIS